MATPLVQLLPSLLLLVVNRVLLGDNLPQIQGQRGKCVIPDRPVWHRGVSTACVPCETLGLELVCFNLASFLEH